MNYQQKNLPQLVTLSKKTKHIKREAKINNNKNESQSGKNFNQ